jgi:hypothetical protein
MRWREWDGSNEQIATLYASMTPTGKAEARQVPNIVR